MRRGKRQAHTYGGADALCAALVPGRPAALCLVHYLEAQRLVDTSTITTPKIIE